MSVISQQASGALGESCGNLRIDDQEAGRWAAPGQYTCHGPVLAHCRGTLHTPVGSMDSHAHMPWQQPPEPPTPHRPPRWVGARRPGRYAAPRCCFRGVTALREDVTLSEADTRFLISRQLYGFVLGAARSFRHLHLHHARLAAAGGPGAVPC